MGECAKFLPEIGLVRDFYIMNFSCNCFVLSIGITSLMQNFLIIVF